MAEIFLIADTHFNHGNILGFTQPDGSLVRSFSSTDEMNEVMIQRWNRVVGKNDKVYHLGDVYFGDAKEADVILKRLNGKKRLVVGNHDDIKSQVIQGNFEKVHLWRKFGDKGLLLTHVPVHPSVLGGARFGKKDTMNVHGHIHKNPSPEGPYRCVSVEQIDYTPINIEGLL